MPRHKSRRCRRRSARRSTRLPFRSSRAVAERSSPLRMMQKNKRTSDVATSYSTPSVPVWDKCGTCPARQDHVFCLGGENRLLASWYATLSATFDFLQLHDTPHPQEHLSSFTTCWYLVEQLAWFAWLAKNAIVFDAHKQGNIPLTHRHIPLTWLLSIQEITIMPRWKLSLLGRRSPWSRSFVDVSRVALPVL
jgi:hypothetical protein